MSTVKVETYSIAVKRRNSRKDEKYALDEIIGGRHFLNVFNDYLESLGVGASTSEVTKSVLTFETPSLHIARNVNYWHISGRFNVGSYGTANDIVNIDTLDITHNKGNREAEMIPLFFLLYGKPGFSKAILVLQRYGINGCISQFRNSVRSFVADNHNDISLEIMPLIPKDIINTLINDGSINQVILRRNSLPRRSQDILHAKGFTESVRSMIVTFKGDGDIIEKATLRGWINNPEANHFTVEELREFGFDGQHSVLIKVSMNGKLREIDFSDTLKLRPYIDIHQDLAFDGKNHPEIGSIREICLGLVTTLFNDGPG